MTDADELIDFDGESCGNTRTTEENQNRWNLLLKGIMNIMPGRRINPSVMARKMIEDIRASPERYVQWAVPKRVTVKSNRTGLNKYINIHDFYKENFV